MKIKSIYILLVLFLLLSSYSLSINTASGAVNYYSGYDLPPSLFMNTSIENVIQRRTCIRVFSDEPVTDKQLSTVLWSAYGVRDDGIRTVSSINGNLAVKIYVMREEAVYWYDPMNHS
jgi:hypothetical protein